jgi:hypothetical protein
MERILKKVKQQEIKIRYSNSKNINHESKELYTGESKYFASRSRFILVSLRPVTKPIFRIRSWIVENYYKIERQVSMRDGVKLFTISTSQRFKRKTSHINNTNTLFMRSLRGRKLANFSGTVIKNIISAKGISW